MKSNICVIVGVGGGLGMALARRFAAEGFRLVLLARREPVLEEFAAQLALEGIEAHSFPLDASNTDAVAQTFEAIKTQVGIPEVLIYNAAAIREGLPSAVTPQEWLADYQVNVVGALACAQQVIAPLREAGRTGLIVFTGGGLALHPRAAYASLAADKAALRSLAFSLAEELAPDDVHVATVTIAGSIERHTAFDPDVIAELYWRLYQQDPAHWQTEIVFTGTPTRLMRALDFDNDDLQANRQGRLSIRQQARLQAAFQSNLQNAQFSTTLVASVLTAMAAWLGGRRLGGLLAWSGFSAALTWLAQSRLTPASQLALRSVTGPAHKHTGASGSQREHRHFLRIKGINFAVERAVYDLIDEGMTYRVYYVGGEIQALEPVAS